MLSSLRARLLLWYTLILAGVIVAFASIAGLLFWRSLLAGIDRDLEARSATIVQALHPVALGGFDLDRPVEYQQPDASSAATAYYAVWTRTGELIDCSIDDCDIAIPTELGLRTRAGHREIAVAAVDGARVLVGRDLAPVQGQVLAFAGAAAAAGSIALVAALLGGWFLVGRALAPIARISSTAAAMAGGDLSARILVERTENELEQVALALNQAFDRLQLAVHSQQRFTADASHELRTPLATILGDTEWVLARERSPSEYRQIAESCRRAAHRMREIVERLLTLARADAAEIHLEHQPVSLAPIVEDALTILRPLANNKKVTLQTRVDGATIAGDRDRLTELVTNVVSNAIQYNRDGGQVNVEVWPDGQNAWMRVSDTGIGIEAEHLPQVFERFFRTDGARSAHAGGAGLGLSIAKWIVDAHGGEIACQSVLGKGTEVLIRLPRVA
jgi:two-component system, OmpR family, sensor kinase